MSGTDCICFIYFLSRWPCIVWWCIHSERGGRKHRLLFCAMVCPVESPSLCFCELHRYTAIYLTAVICDPTHFTLFHGTDQERHPNLKRIYARRSSRLHIDIDMENQQWRPILIPKKIPGQWAWISCGHAIGSTWLGGSFPSFSQGCVWNKLNLAVPVPAQGH
ncbi:hypothetical protein BC939DRAFT_453448 [Gamsiella multidivaricata]|uniref:uncharacterized protein n=1 Tax=Gamsiella multidivaricata TaxID=101098 RepID=UPI00221E7043|nr:uncharacterized protein BC939DRAFT_453448 [Gamsiella multidivaricata]KAI7822724.1 hypothetical protein BC939DRAFT_453448 [Gamsiella multidivaricata]